VTRSLNQRRTRAPMDAVAPDLGSHHLVHPTGWGFMTERVGERSSSFSWSRRRRPSLALARRSDAGFAPEQLWDLHGTPLFALACTVLGDERKALRAVTLGMVDLYAASDAGPARAVDESLQAAARCVYEQCEAMLAEHHIQRTVRVPPLMVWLGELARSQRGALALCVFGGHDYRQAAHVLDLSPSAVAGLLTAGLQELGAIAAAETASGAED